MSSGTRGGVASGPQGINCPSVTGDSMSASPISSTALIMAPAAVKTDTWIQTLKLAVDIYEKNMKQAYQEIYIFIIHIDLNRKFRSYAFI
jgi:hypothetical protein